MNESTIKNKLNDLPSEVVQELISTIESLSQARDMQTLTRLVSESARRLTGADGAAFVLRDEDRCYYVDEDAIGPLWKGRRFPLKSCISGWSMLNKLPVCLEDIYLDPRIPADAYRPTFVKSLIVVPIRKSNPIGAIGNYWAKQHRPTDVEVNILQALADTTSVALENLELYAQLQQKVQDLQDRNYELERYAWVASHDLREPLRSIVTSLELIERRCGETFDSKTTEYFDFAVTGARRLQNLVKDILSHTQAIEKAVMFEMVDSREIAQESIKTICALDGANDTNISISQLPVVRSSPELLAQVFGNLVSNAFKFRSQDRKLKLEIGANADGADWIFFVRDNGIGIDPNFHERIFKMFQRLHPQDSYEGSGLGLAICKKILERHKGKIWLESQLGIGSTFYFSIPASAPGAEMTKNENRTLTNGHPTHA